MTRNGKRRIFAIGDIHGRHERLARLLDQLPMDPARDLFVFLGDYINRGPHAREVIDCLLAFETRCAHTVFLMGNHEQALLDYAATGDLDLLRLLRRIGVEATLASYGDAAMSTLRDLSFLPPAHRDFLERLRPFHRADGYLFVHAGVGGDPDADPGRESLEVRRLFLEEPVPGKDVVVFGHTGFDTPLCTPDKIGIDTGAGQDALLTALELPARIFHHA